MSDVGVTLKIEAVSAVPLRIPFSHGGEGASSGGPPWTALETLLVRVETTSGLVGCGEAFCYAGHSPAQAVV